ncbi:DEAD/DEAH box helicase [Cucumibacter marinus]|uniref:DEAD/DEAH box helicase n=1 Tax=Cucumibacter marinus TaxID=1121252 RepID=UPI0003FE8647|nr:DEAD/DEAH box helicase [Cucumibacter marinus]
MTEFSSLGLAEPLTAHLAEAGLETPTPIQREAIPLLLTGRDMVGIAQTGTGKTAAFALPILHALASEEHRKPRPRRVATLILSPTRELAAQIAQNIRSYGKPVRPRIAVIVGGVKHGPQIKDLTRGADIIVATPGRMLDHLQSGAVTLDHTRTVVLDEADQMLDLGFMPVIRKILAKSPKRRQTVLFSATMPKQIRALAEDFLNDPIEVSVAPASKPIEQIDQRLRHVAKAGKAALLAELLGGETVERAIVFTRTKHGADKVTKQLGVAGIDAAAIHGNKSQGQRVRALQEFRNGSVPILVATDIAARGIDVPDVSHVFNFDLPEVAEAYVHRIGRTARAGKTGVAISFCDPAERGLLRSIEKLIGRRIENDGAEPAEVGEEPAEDRSKRRGQGRGGRKPNPVRGKAFNGPRKPAEGRGASRDADQAEAGEKRTPDGGKPRSDKPRGGKPFNARAEGNKRGKPFAGHRKGAGSRNGEGSGDGAQGGARRADGKPPRGEHQPRNDNNPRNGKPGGKPSGKRAGSKSAGARPAHWRGKGGDRQGSARA